MSSLQSAYRVHLSTETAVLRVIADILQALDHGDFAALTLLMDLSAAFDTVGHATLLRRLQLSYGIRGMALSWLRSYLSDRTQFVRSGSTSLRPALLRYGVSQGTVLGPILFYCIQLTLSVSSPCMGCAPIYMLTTPKYTASAHRASLVISRVSCLWMGANHHGVHHTVERSQD